MPEQDHPSAVLDAMGEAALLRDGAGKVLWVNRAFCDLFGGAPDDWRGRDFGSPRTPEADGRRRYEGETATRRGRRWVEWEETVLDTGRVLSVGRDITERRQGEEALKGARDQAEAARRVGKAFFSAVTHELRTPLNGVLGMAGLLENTELKPDQAEYVAAISESGGHLLAMVNDVLDAARLEAGELELEEGSVDCAAMVRSVVELLSPRAFEKGVEIASAVDPAIPDIVRGDEGRLRQILFNLTGAALRRTETGGVVIMARLEAPVRDGLAQIALSVADDGPPLSEEARVGMVDPTLMGEDAGADAENAGLGLVVARRLVGAMNGDLEIETPPERGTKITVRLFLQVETETEAAAPRPLEGRTVVVAAGSAALRDALRRQLRLLGAEAVTAASPDAAARELGALPGSVLLADAPWARRLSKAARGAASAGVLLRPDQRAMIDTLGEMGFGFYLMKPVRAASLAARIGGGDAAEAEADPGDGAEGRELVEGARILLAEDNRVNALLASTMLRGEGCHVDIAGDGAEAVDAVQRAPYDMVFMDIRMPVKNGLEAAREIRALGGRYAEMPIVALTANAFAEDREACLAAGMNDFATKPIDMDGVADLLQKWTRAPKQAKLA